MSTTIQITPLDGSILKDSVEQKVLILSVIDIFPTADTVLSVLDKNGVEVATAKLLQTKLTPFANLLAIDFDNQAHPALNSFPNALAEVLRQFPSFDQATKVTSLTIVPTLVGGAQ